MGISWQGGAAQSASLTRKLLKRDAILRRTGFIEGGVPGGSGNLAGEAPWHHRPPCVSGLPLKTAGFLSSRAACHTTAAAWLVASPCWGDVLRENTFLTSGTV